MKTLTFPFVMLPNAALWQKIGSHAKCLFAALISHVNRKTGLCNPALKTLAGELGTSLSTMRRALDKLRRAGMVIVRRTLFGNRYQIATPDRWQTTISATECALTDEQCATLTDERTQRSRVSAEEPDVLELYTPSGAVLLLSAVEETEETATTTTPAAGGIQPKSPTPPPPVPDPVMTVQDESEAEKLVNELLPYHPWKGNRPWAVRAIAKVLSQDPAAADQIRRSHVAMRPHWEIEQSLSPGKFRPPLGQWIEEGNWKVEAAKSAERKDVKRETWEDRRRREQKESDDESYRMYAELGMWEAIRQFGGDELVEVWREKVKQAC